MHIDAISVGRPKEVEYEGKTMRTSIFKTPVEGPQKVTFTNIEGDEQANLKVHGGPTRPICVYASEYYAYWEEVMGVEKLPWGFFGENLNITGGVFEEKINVGDRFEVGTVILEALQPRFPCNKLGMKMGDKKYIKEVLDTGKTGFYVGVVQEGIISPGDEVKRTFINSDTITIDDITQLYYKNRQNRPLLEKAITVDALTEDWREYFTEQLAKLD